MKKALLLLNPSFAPATAPVFLHFALTKPHQTTQSHDQRLECVGSIQGRHRLGANLLPPGMWETYFGSLIEEVEGRIIEQQQENWNRDVFKNYLLGYAVRTDRHRLMSWKDHRFKDKEPL